MPLMLWNQTDVKEYLGAEYTAQVRAMRMAGRMPEPFAETAGGIPLWLPSDIVLWAQTSAPRAYRRAA